MPVPQNYNFYLKANKYPNFWKESEKPLHSQTLLPCVINSLVPLRVNDLPRLGFELTDDRRWPKKSSLPIQQFKIFEFSFAPVSFDGPYFCNFYISILSRSLCEATTVCEPTIDCKSGILWAFHQMLPRLKYLLPIWQPPFLCLWFEWRNTHSHSPKDLFNPHPDVISTDRA